MPPDSQEDLHSIQSLRDILAKSATTTTSPNSPKQTSSPTNDEYSIAIPIPVNTSPTRSSSKTTTANTPVLQFPTMDLPGSSSKSSTHTTPKTSPLKYGGSFFQSFRGRSPFDADEDEFDHGRKYSMATLRSEPKSIAAVIMSTPSAHTTIRDQRGSSESESVSTGTLRGGSWVPAVTITGENESNGRQDDTKTAYKKEEDEAPSTPILTTIASPQLHSPSPLPSTSPESPSKLQDGSFFQSFRGRSPFDADEDEFSNSRSYTTAALSSPPTTPTANQTSRVRSISWADQVNPAPSEITSEQLQTKLGSKHDDDENNRATLSLTSTLDFAPSSTAAAPLNGSKTIRAPRIRIMSSALTAARDISPHKGNMWDPDDDEWADVDDATNVVETFKASYRSPVGRSPVKSSVLSYFQDTIKSVLLSPTKKAAEEKLRHDERVQDQIDELRNTYNCDPNGDLHDEIMKTVVIRDPSGHFYNAQSPRSMHILDLDAYFQTDDPLLQEARPRLSDAVATILLHTSKACLDAFLNPSIKHCTYRREVDRSKGGLMLIIRREGNEVICGAYVNFGFMLQWKLYVKSIVSITGQWHEVYATTKPGLMRIDNGTPEWGVIRPDAPETKGEEVDLEKVDGLKRKLELSPRKKKIVISEDVNETNPKFMLYQSRVLARHLLWDIWYLFDKMYDCRATWEADGEETEMRLKRELVGSGDDED